MIKMRTDLGKPIDKAQILGTDIDGKVSPIFLLSSYYKNYKSKSYTKFFYTNIILKRQEGHMICSLASIMSHISEF